jgi:nucleoside-diphosphate-sugar epimerase
MTDATERAVLITGAAGFVGRALAGGLAAQGWRVTGLDRTAPPDAGPFADFVTGDLLDPAALAPLAQRPAPAAVVHLAGLRPGPAPLGELFAVNVGGTAAALAQLARPGCHFVLVSTGLVYGNQPGPFTEAMPPLPSDPYAQSKLAAEALVTSWGRAWRSPVSVLRPSVLYGSGAPAGMLLRSLLQALRAGEPFAMTAGEQRRDFLHVDDAAAAIGALLARRLEGTWNLASGESPSVREAAELAASIAGRPELLRVGALPYRPGEVFDYRLDASGLRRALDWRPRIGLAAGLARLWQELA